MTPSVACPTRYAATISVHHSTSGKVVRLLSHQSWQDALQLNTRRNELQLDLEVMLGQVDETVAHVIVCDPYLLGSFDEQQPDGVDAHPHKDEQPSSITAITLHRKLDVHVECARRHKLIVTLTEEWQSIQGQIDDALLSHDIPRMESLHSSLERVEANMAAHDAARGRLFIHEALACRHVQRCILQCPVKESAPEVGETE
ncbi:hypothetical protein DYB36_012549 [Aphanomyces astaci]|uniref:Uncharacterized protein n=1 Tax=Aphanomyces astaci TaxID=112090 RepID=A0A397ABA8_APHAT|nr:hypothetical protein DYB36_012549 [Aphanomyces astaci]